MVKAVRPKLAATRLRRPGARARGRRGHPGRPQARTVLDVGCGTGRLLERLAQAYPTARLAGVDAAAGMAVVAARRHRVAAVVGVAEQLPFRSGSVQLLVSTISFHHWGDQRRGLAEVRRVLDPGGHLLLTDPIVTGWLRPFFAVGRARDRFHTPAELDAMLGNAGLRAGRRSLVPGMWGGGGGDRRRAV
jgi:SAM-dependent methyltransferase